MKKRKNYRKKDKGRSEKHGKKREKEFLRDMEPENGLLMSKKKFYKEERFVDIKDIT